MNPAGSSDCVCDVRGLGSHGPVDGGGAGGGGGGAARAFAGGGLGGGFRRGGAVGGGGGAVGGGGCHRGHLGGHWCCRGAVAPPYGAQDERQYDC